MISKFMDAAFGCWHTHGTVFLCWFARANAALLEPRKLVLTRSVSLRKQLHHLGQEMRVVSPN